MLSGELPNGLRYIINPDSTAKTLSLQLLVLAGSRTEPQGQRGLAHLVEHLLFDGTEAHNTSSLLQQVYDYGGELNAYTNTDLAVFHCKMRGIHIERMLSFFSEILYTSLFSEEDIQREKEIVLQEVSMRTSAPAAYLALVHFPQTAWRGTPAEQPVGGNREEILALTRDQVLDFVHSRYCPQNIVLSLSGQVDGIGAVPLLKHYFNLTPKITSCPSPQWAMYIPQQHQQVLEEGRRGKGDAVVAMAFPYMTYQHEHAIEVLNSLLIDTMNSRLFVRLRTQLALVYSVESCHSQLADVSLFGFAFTVKNNHELIQRCLTEATNILENLKTVDVSQEELDRAVSFVQESKLLALEDSMVKAAYYGEQLLLKKEVKNYEQEIENLDLLQPMDIRKTCVQLFANERLNLAVLA